MGKRKKTALWVTGSTKIMNPDGLTRLKAVLKADTVSHMSYTVLKDAS